MTPLARVAAVWVTMLACVLLVSDRGTAETVHDLPPGGGRRAQLLDRIRAEPREGEGFAALASWLFQHGDAERARAAAAEAVRLQPDVARYQRLLGYLAASDGDDDAAAEAFRHAAEIDPTAHVSLADFRLAQAWAEYQRASFSGRPDAVLDERLRALGAAAEIAPELKALMQSRLAAEPVPPAEIVPPIYLGSEIARAVVVEKRTQMLRVYEREGGDLILRQTYPCTTGQAVGGKRHEGDLRTPDGVYFVTDLLPGDDLPELYGAFALPLSYPNAWDSDHGRTGYGIWLHGSDRLGSPFVPRDTKGCVLVRNDDLTDLAGLVAPAMTPILISEEIDYRPVAAWKAEVRELLAWWPNEDVLAVVGGPEYTLVLQRRDGRIWQDFTLRTETGWRVVAREQIAPVAASEWQRKLDEVRPAKAADLVRVRIVDADGSPQVIIETTEPTRVRGFQPEFARRLYLDLPGLRVAPLPTVIRGDGSWVKEVRLAAAEIDPPTARLAIDLMRPMTYSVAAEGTRVVVSLLRQ